MKILLLITKGEIGGAQVFVRDLALGLKSKGHEVWIACGQDGYLSEEAAAGGLPFVLFKSLRRSANPLLGGRFILELKRFLDKESFDLVHFNSSNALIGIIGLKMARSKPKSVFTVHGLSVLDQGYKAGILKKTAYHYFFKMFLSLFNRVVFVSSRNLEAAQASGLIKKGELIYNGVSIQPEEFYPANVSRAFFSHLSGADLATAYLVGSVGRLAYPKNFEFLITAFKKIKASQPEAKLLLIGEGPEREKYERLIISLGLQGEVFLPGEVRNARHYLKGFDLFVLPSHYEGLSLTLIEARAAGIPILASRVGGSPEILPEACLFEVDNEQDFLSKIKTAQTAVDKGEFSLVEMTERYESLYKNI